VKCAGLPNLTLSARQASSADEAMERFYRENEKPLRTAGGFICVTDCETGRERRYRCRAARK
jgi:hypothetical protein